MCGGGAARGLSAAARLAAPACAAERAACSLSEARARRRVGALGAHDETHERVGAAAECRTRRAAEGSAIVCARRREFAGCGQVCIAHWKLRPRDLLQ